MIMMRWFTFYILSSCTSGRCLVSVTHMWVYSMGFLTKLPDDTPRAKLTIHITHRVQTRRIKPIAFDIMRCRRFRLLQPRFPGNVTCPSHPTSCERSLDGLLKMPMQSSLEEQDERLAAALRYFSAPTPPQQGHRGPCEWPAWQCSLAHL